MKISIPKSGRFSVVKLFLCVIALPSILVLLTVCNMQKESSEHKVTHEVFFDIEIGGKPEGRIVMGLFGETVPLTVRNFYTFATSGVAGRKYEGTKIHRVIKKFLIQGGDVVNGDGSGRTSIYGETFPDENFLIHHSSAGFLSMANSGKNTNGCQFFITTLATNWLDGKHVAFGKVVQGQSIVHKIEYLPTDWEERPVKAVRIAKSGSLVLNSPYWISDDPYNLKDWLKTISIPLGVSFSIIFVFSRFMNVLDNCIDAEDELLKKEKTIKKELKEKKAAKQKPDAPEGGEIIPEAPPAPPKPSSARKRN